MIGTYASALFYDIAQLGRIYDYDEYAADVFHSVPTFVWSYIYRAITFLLPLPLARHINYRLLNFSSALIFIVLIVLKIDENVVWVSNCSDLG